MGRANNERPSCSSKAQQIFRSVVGIHHKSFNILILVSKSFLSQVFVLDMGGSMLGFLNSHKLQSITLHLPLLCELSGLSYFRVFRLLVRSGHKPQTVFGY